MPDENKRPITGKSSSRKTSAITSGNSNRGLSLPVALSFFLVIMLVATVWSAAELSLSWPFLILFTCASLGVITFTRFEGLFLATCSVPLFFGIFSVATGWLISELQTSTDSRGATSLVASFYPFVQHFPVLLITALGGVIIAVFRWTGMSHKVTTAAERGERERRDSLTSNTRLSQQSSTARRLNTDSLRKEAAQRPPERLQDRVLSPAQTTQRPAQTTQRRSPSTAEGALYRPPTTSRRATQPTSASNSELLGSNALGLGNQRSLQGSTQVPLLVDGKKPSQDYAGGIVSKIPQVSENDSSLQPKAFSSSENGMPQYPSGGYTGNSRDPRSMTPRFYSNSPEAERNIDREIDDLAQGIFGDLATPHSSTDTQKNPSNGYRDVSTRNPEPVYPEFRSNLMWRRKPSRHTTDTGQIDVSDILNRENRAD